MKAIPKNLLISIGAAFIISQAQVFLKSTYVIDFLEQNLVSILIMLLAINTASLGIVLSKIRELMDSNPVKDGFKRSKREMLFSIVEQIALIFISLLLLTVSNSETLENSPQVVYLVEMAVITCFVYAMQILWDTAHGIFIILSFNGEE